MGDVLDIVQDGVNIKHVIDTKSILMLGLAFFLALTLSLVLYAKVIR
ncbi:MAG: hypothetical protein AAF242_16250 [Bacteroidota bacterium]